MKTTGKMERRGVRRRWIRALLCSTAFIGMNAVLATRAMAIDVASQADWNTAVVAVAAAGAGSTVSINFTSGFTLTSSLAPLQASNTGVIVDITGNSQTIDGASTYQGIQVDGANAPTVNISNLAVANTAAIGGNGQNGQAGYKTSPPGTSGLAYGSGGGGGGGLGAGGGLLVGSGANVTVSNVTFSGNSATGGAGGTGGSVRDIAPDPVNGGDGGVGGAANNGGASGGGGTGGNGGGTGTQGTPGTAGPGFGDGGGGGGGSGTTNSTSYTSNNPGGTGNASGGNGGPGGDGVFNNSGSGGSGADGGYGGNGGAAQGGAIYVATGGTLTILDTGISGAAATGGTGGSPGVGQGPSAFNGSAGGNGSAQGAGIFLSGVTATVGVTSGTQTYNNTVGGTGLTTSGVTTAINKTGAGTLVFGATNTFTGNINVTAGSVSIAATANLGNIANDVVISGGGTLAVTGTTTLANGRTFSIAGTSTLDIATGTTTTLQGVVGDGGSAGTLVKGGAGTLLLSAANTYTAGTNVTGGTLQLGNADAMPTASGLTVATGATLDANGFNLNFTGGTVNVNGTLSGATTTISTGVTLGGNGFLDALDIASGATIAPGNSIGTLHVNGNFTTAAGSVFSVEVAPDGTSDLIEVTGTATLSGGSVRVSSSSVAADFAMTPTTYTILTATAGVTGTFDAAVDTSALAFFNGSLVYSVPNTVQLVLMRNDASFQSIAATPNQVATAGAITDLGGSNPIYQSILGLSTPDARAAFDQLSGEGYATAQSAMIQDAGVVRDAVTDRVMQAFDALTGAEPSNYMAAEGTDASPAWDGGIWGSGYGQHRSTSSDGNAGAASDTIGGVFAGVDGTLNGTTLGALFGYGRTAIDIGSRNTTISSHDFTIAGYTGTEWETMNLVLGASYTRHLLSSTRLVTVPSAQTLTASYQAGTTQLFAELSDDIDMGSVTLTPFGSLAYVSVASDGITETGGSAALTTAADSAMAMLTTLGLRGSSSFVLGETMLAKVTAGVGWQHAFASTPDVANQFIGGTPFTVSGLPIAADALNLEAGLDIDASDSLSLGFVYDGQIAASGQSHKLTASFTGKF